MSNRKRNPLHLAWIATFFAVLMQGCQKPSSDTTVAGGNATRISTLDGNEFTLRDSTGKATVLIFLLPDCPIANGYAPEITRINKDYNRKQVRIVLVYADRDITLDKARQHYADYSHACDAVIDPQLSLAVQTGAKVTPEAVLLSPNGAVLYRGRIDDRFPAYGKRRDKPTKTELRDAMDAFLAGRPIAVARTKAIGCFLDLP